MDVMDELRSVGATRPPSHEALSAVRDAILGEAGRVVAAPSQRRWLQHRVLASLTAIALVGGGSVAVWSVTRTTTPKTTTTIECGTDTFIPVETASPVADCREWLSSQGGTVPPLVGWITPRGLVAVLPDGVAPPADSTPLPSGFEVDAGVRFVTDALGDAAGPLAAGCLSPTAATQFAKGQLAIAGLTWWHVAVDTSRGATSCDAYAAIVNAPSATVVLDEYGASQGATSDPVTRLEAELHAQLVSGPNAQCLTTRAASVTASRDAAALGIASDAVVISDAGRIGRGERCATPFVEPGGSVDVVLWQEPHA